MSSKWSTLCHLTTCFWIWFLLGYSVSVIAYASYGMGQATAAQRRPPLDDMTRLLINNTACPFCASPLRHRDSDADANAAAQAPGLAATEEQCVARVQHVAEQQQQHRRSLSVPARSPPWTSRAFWVGIGMFACYWVLFGFFLASTAVEVGGGALGVEDGFAAVDGRDGRGGGKRAAGGIRLI